MSNVSTRTNTLAKLGILAAISVVLVAIVHFPLIPAASFLEYDPADIPILICAFAYGPVAGIIVTVIAAAIQALTVSASGGVKMQLTKKNIAAVIVLTVLAAALVVAYYVWVYKPKA